MKKILTTLLLSSCLVLLTGCGGGSSSSGGGNTLSGSAFKGPIDGAITLVTNAAEETLVTSSSTLGAFSLNNLTLPAATEAVFIETQGGTYTDEATGSLVLLGSNGLMNVFTAAELQIIMNNSQVIALTPETTIMALLVKNMLASGTSASAAIIDAKQRVQTQLIDGTNPVSIISGDNLLLIGNLNTDLPADQSEALARNRAISFSYEANSLNLTPLQVFELINARALDLQDGTLDGKEGGVTPIPITDKNGNNINLDTIDQKTNYGLARLRLLNNTIQRFSNGQLSPNEQAGFAQLGFDSARFNQLSADNQAAVSSTQALLTDNTLPAFQHLPVMVDEDNNSTNAAATYTLTATPDINVTVNAPGASWITPMLRYNGNQLPPVIKANRGDIMTLNLVNNLANASTIHWHGFKIPGDQDGGPDFPVASGSSKTYSFTMSQPAAPLWFHPHPDMKTGSQVYNGLAGIFLLNDAINQQLETNKQLPSGNYDIPLLVQDRRFATEISGVRDLVYMNTPMDRMGMFGDKILVNNTILPKLNVETRQYRFRIYNTSNARTYDFALSDGASFSIIGTDGGLLPQPTAVDHIVLGPAERAEIVIDFSQYTVNDKIMLISKAFNDNLMGLMGMMDMGNMNGGGMSGGGMNGGGMNGGGMNGGGMNGGGMNGEHLDIMRFDVTTQVTDDVTLYTALPNTADINTQRLVASDATKTRNFVMTIDMGDMSGDMSNMSSISFKINGKIFDMNRIDEIITLSEGNTEIWSVQNMSMMAHPFHAHAIQWQILDRTGKAATGSDLGWKDTVLVQPGEIVRMIGRFDPAINTGDYMYHCHILEHEDAGMMGFFKITP